LLKRHSTISHAKFQLESRGESFKEYEDAHKAYWEGIKNVRKKIPSTMRTQVVNRVNLSTFQFGDKDLVVAIGDSGMLVNVAKYVGNQLAILVNPDPYRLDGTLATCKIEDFARTLDEVLIDKAKIKKLTMAEARLNDGQILYALNDLFIGMNNHQSARYRIEYNEKVENQSSSGIVVSTGTGSTGWLTSIVTGANTIAGVEANKNLPVPFLGNENYLMFVIREPFPSVATGTSIVYGRILPDQGLKIVSNMGDKGIIFSDGMSEDFIAFSTGMTTTIQPSEKKVNLVVRTK